MTNSMATGKAAGSQDASSRCESAAKWAVVVEDVLIPLPQRLVRTSVIKAQAGILPEFVLVRDHNSPDDVVLEDDECVDLAEGNVFYRLKRCEVQPRDCCHDPAKLAFVVNDRAEIVIRPQQTGQSLRELFGLASHTHLLRDVESPHDKEIGLEDVVQFLDGPVFYVREVQSTLKITVNARVFTEQEGVKSEMTKLQIAALVYPENPQETRVYFVSDGKREISEAEAIKIRGCEVFDVVRQEVTGGFEQSRVDRELEQLRSGGLKITLVGSPANAVVYHDLRTRPGSAIEASDVLVPIPSGYPGSYIDFAYLPVGSPLIGKLKGEPQEQRIEALGRQWQRISYHPHKGGGGPKWNPTQHGFHTYLGELLSWLYNAR